MKIYPFGSFIFGTISKLPPNQIPDGAASDSLNWLTLKGRLELNRGYKILGTEVTGSSSRVSGIRVGIRPDGTNIAYMTYDQKVRYYSDAIGDWTEVGNNLLPLAAKGEDITMDLLESPAGKQMWLNSPHTGPYKFNISNPGDAISMYDANKNYKGWMRFFDNRAWIWSIDAFDLTTVRQSYIELRGRTDYTQIASESVATGAAVAQKGSNPNISILDVSVAAGGETFSDDLNGNLVGSLGGTGTVNYQTCTVTVIPASGPVASALVTYRYIDETATWTTGGGATEGGIANLIVPNTRVSGNPNVFQQAHGGNLLEIVNFNNNHYCFHQRAVYNIIQSQDDATSTNEVYRENLGIQRLRGAYSMTEGVYTIDMSDPANPRFVVVQYSKSTPDIKPLFISEGLDLTNYVFDKAVVYPFNDYVLYEIRQIGSPDNNRTFAYHRIYKTWDILDYCFSCADQYNGTLIAGDSLSPNVQVLFSGFDADGDTINNFWTSGISRLGFITPRGKPRIIYGQKKAKRIYLEGYIQTNQNIRMYASLDRGQFVEILDDEGNAFIQGTGSYIDKSQAITIGSDILGDHPIGSTPQSNAVQASHYARYLPFHTDRFEEIQIKLVADGIGYASVIRLEFRDIRVLQDKPSKKYRVD